MSATQYDWPDSLAGACGRIDAYRSALRKTVDALLTAYPYVNGVVQDASVTDWRDETARTSLAEIEAALDLARRELAVTNP